MKATFTAALALAGSVAAQSGAWGQCGGQGWTGDTTCIDGWHCVYFNDWYSQCLEGDETTTSTTTTTTEEPSGTTSDIISTSSTTTTTTIPTSTSTDFPTTSGLFFNIDGTSQYYAGTNCYWCSFLTADEDIENAYSHMASSGIKILRIWGFNDVSSQPGDSDVYYQYLSSSGSVINTGEYGLQLLDKNVAFAEQYGIKLIINFVNYWDDYGGMNAYVSAFGLSTRTDFYTSEEAQTQYKNYIEAVVSRYSDSSAIFAWELANEPRCPGCDLSVLVDWATEISQYIKSLDPEHMVTLGDEGFGIEAEETSYPYQYGEGLDWVELLSIPTLDFGTFHMYPESWGVDAVSFAQPWIEAHAAACVAAGKPCLLEEYGMTYDHCTIESPWQEVALNTEGMSGDAFWQWGDSLPSWGGTSHNDGHTIYYGSDDWECLVEEHVADIDAIY